MSFPLAFEGDVNPRRGRVIAHHRHEHAQGDSPPPTGQEVRERFVHAELLDVFDPGQ